MTALTDHARILDTMSSEIEVFGATARDELFYATHHVGGALQGDHSTSISSLNSTFHAFFTQQRSDEFNSTIKQQTRDALIKHMNSLGLKVLTQTFVVRTSSPLSNGRYVKLKGVNIIGVLEGKVRRNLTQNKQDSITVIGGHYDTVSKECALTEKVYVNHGFRFSI